MSSLSFFAADTLGMALNKGPEGLYAQEKRFTPLGPWNLQFPISVDSDVINAKVNSFWVQVSKRLWFYLVVTDDVMWLLAFDAQLINLTDKNFWKFGGFSVQETVTALVPAIKGTFRWEKDEWRTDDFSLTDLPK